MSFCFLFFAVAFNSCLSLLLLRLPSCCRPPGPALLFSAHDLAEERLLRSPTLLFSLAVALVDDDASTPPGRGGEGGNRPRLSFCPLICRPLQARVPSSRFSPQVVVCYCRSTVHFFGSGEKGGVLPFKGHARSLMMAASSLGADKSV